MMGEKMMNSLDRIKLAKQNLLLHKLHVIVSYNVLEYKNTDTKQEGYSANREFQVFIKKIYKGYNYGLIIELIRNNLVLSIFSDDGNLEHHDLDFIVAKMSVRIKELVATIKTYIKEKKVPDKALVEKVIGLSKTKVNSERVLIYKNPSSLFSNICGDILRLIKRDKNVIIRFNDEKIRGI